MNVSLYDQLVIFRNHHENRHFHVRPDFDFNLINRFYHSTLCNELINLLVVCNQNFVELFHRYTFFNIFNEQQRKILEHTVIDGNDFVLYALFILEKTPTQVPDDLKDIFYIFEKNVKDFFFDIVSFKNYFKNLNVEDLGIPNTQYY